MKPKITIKLGAPPPKKEEESEYSDASISDIADMLKDMKGAMDGDDFEEAARLFCAAMDLHSVGQPEEELEE